MCPRIPLVLIVAIASSLPTFASAQTTRSVNQLTDDKQEGLQQFIDNTVREYGTVESSEVVEIRSPISSTLLQIVAEGSEVIRGDVLVELDATTLKEQVGKQEILVAQAQAQQVQAEHALKNAAASAELIEAAADAQHKLTKLTRASLLAEDGELAIQLQLHESDRRLAEIRRDASAKALDSLGQTTAPLEATSAQLELKSAEEALKRAQLLLRQFTEYERPRRKAEGELAAAKMQLEAAQFENDAKARVRSAEAALVSATAGLALAEQQLQSAKEQLQSSRMVAPRDGVVLRPLATRGTSTTDPLAPGSVVQQGQPLARIADLNNLRVNVRVNETRIQRVRVGQLAEIQFDALPGRLFKGRVTQIKSAPETSSWFNSSVKAYSVSVSLEGVEVQPMIGMSAMVAIDVSRNGRP